MRSGGGGITISSVAHAGVKGFGDGESRVFCRGPPKD